MSNGGLGSCLTNVAIANAVLFNDELELLKLRFDALRDYVDVFVVAESPISFAGNTKPLHFLENMAMFRPEDLARTQHYVYRLDHCTDRWEREREANKCVLERCLELPNPTVTLLCDADEFPSPDQLEKARRVTEPRSIPMTTYYRRINWEVAYSPHLPMGVAVPNFVEIDQIPGNGMHQRSLTQLEGRLGTHLSYLGFRALDLETKYGSFSHSELDFPAASSHALLALADEYAVDHLGRPLWRGGGLLRFRPASSWDSTQRLTAERLPWSVADGPPRGNRFSRLAAAVLIDKVVNRRSDYWYRRLPAVPLRLWVDLSTRDRLVLAATTIVAALRRPFYGKAAALRRRLVLASRSRRLSPRP